MLLVSDNESMFHIYHLAYFIISFVSRRFLWTLIDIGKPFWYILWCLLQSKRLTRQNRILRQHSGGSNTGLTDHACRPCLMLDRDVCSRVYVGAVGCKGTTTRRCVPRTTDLMDNLLTQTKCKVKAWNWRLHQQILLMFRKKIPKCGGRQISIEWYNVV